MSRGSCGGVVGFLCIQKRTDEVGYIEKGDQAETPRTLQRTTSKLSRISRIPKYNFHDQPNRRPYPSLSQKRVLFIRAMSRGEQFNNGDGD